MDIEPLVEGVLKIANHPEVVKLTEPNIVYHKDLSKSDVRRVLYAWALIVRENGTDRRSD